MTHERINHSISAAGEAEPGGTVGRAESNAKASPHE